MSAGIYAIVNRRTDDSYVGQASHIERRYIEHRSLLRNGRHHCRKLQQAWDFFGEAAFGFAVVEEVEDKVQRTIAEQRQMDWVRSAGVTLYNTSALATGSALGWKQSDAARQRMSAARKGVPKPHGHGARVSAAMRGRRKSPEHVAKLPQNRAGRKLSAEHRLKVSLALRGRVQSPETRAKIRAAHLGRVVTAETRAKMSASLKGRIISPEWRAKLSAALKGKPKPRKDKRC